MHPLLALPYAALAGVAEALTHLPVDAEHKAWRAIRNRAGGVDRLAQWARDHRDRSRRLLWMHAPSVGEGLQARPVLERIRARHPQVQLLYTFYSPSAERFAQAMLAAGTIDATEYLPFDTVANATRLLDTLSPEAAAHFDRVQRGLSAIGLEYRIDPRLVRGLDYYTHTAFEFRSGALEAAQNTIGGGGRYDGLAASLGGKPTPGIGFGSGIERILLTCDAEGVFGAPDRSVEVFVADLTGGEHARDLTFELRRAGITADRGFDGRSMKSQMKTADRSGAGHGLDGIDRQIDKHLLKLRPVGANQRQVRDKVQ